MSQFTDFVNEELPKRPVLIKGDEALGDPNQSTIPKIQNAPIGSFYMQKDALNELWQKRLEETDNDWVKVGSSTGSGDSSFDALKEKKIIIPQIYTSESIVSNTYLTIPVAADDEIIIGEIDLVDQSTGQVVMKNGEQVTGVIDEFGNVTFNYSPDTDIRIVYGTKVSLAELPEDFLKKHFYTDDDEKNMITVIDDINDLENEIIKENVKPTGLYTHTNDAGTSVVFSYADDPNLSHFVLERYDAVENKWVPYDGNKGIIVP